MMSPQYDEDEPGTCEPNRAYNTKKCCKMLVSQILTAHIQLCESWNSLELCGKCMPSWQSNLAAFEKNSARSFLGMW